MPGHVASARPHSDRPTTRCPRPCPTDTIRAMSATSAWDRAGALPVPADGPARPEVAALQRRDPVGR